MKQFDLSNNVRLSRYPRLTTIKLEGMPNLKKLDLGNNVRLTTINKETFKPIIEIIAALGGSVDMF